LHKSALVVLLAKFAAQLIPLFSKLVPAPVAVVHQQSALETFLETAPNKPFILGGRQCLYQYLT
jgi:hypothetical protein